MEFKNEEFNLQWDYKEEFSKSTERSKKFTKERGEELYEIALRNLGIKEEREQFKDKVYMIIALKLAELGRGSTNPNPMVGAVIVKEGKIIGAGYHEKYGGNHGETNAIKSSIESIEGATIYVTLEPCSHYGKTPPCAERIIKEGIKRVVIGTKDPNPLVTGRGIEKLKRANIEVEIGVLEKESRRLNRIFNHHIVEKMPYVLFKSAMTLDGKIATKIGESKWISSKKSRKLVHDLRNEYSAIMVGVNTVIKDNPELTCRTGLLKKNPVRVIVDSSLRIPRESKVVSTAKDIRTIVAYINNENIAKEKIEYLNSKSLELLEIKEREGKVDLRELMKKLYELGIDSVLLEGGGTLGFSAIKEGIVSRIMFFIAPKIFGGKGRSPVEGAGVSFVEDAFKIDELEVKTVDNDIVIEGVPRVKF